MRRSTAKVIKVELVEGGDTDFSYERPAVTNLKLAILILSTFGLIVGMFALSYFSTQLGTPSR